MTDKIKKALKERLRRLSGNLKAYLESRTRRQRLAIIAAMIAILLLVDIWVMCRSIGRARDAGTDRIESILSPSVPAGPEDGQTGDPIPGDVIFNP